ncbi:hypothetical protein OAJ44_02610 [Chloroflexi bacterium]|nr:hypothetical protein [Chloroflexota bacterium]
MKQLIMLFSISVLTVSVLACGPAVGRAIGDAEVDIDATLAEIEPETDSEKELYNMLKEIDRLHEEERIELLEALSHSTSVIDELLVLIGNDIDLGTTSISAETLTDGGSDDSELLDLVNRAKSARDRESEILMALEKAEKVPWERVKFLNEQLDAANAELGALNEDLNEAAKELDHADQLEAKLVDGLKGQDSEYVALARRAEEASEKIQVIGHILKVTFEDDEEESAAEKLLRLDGRERIANRLEECMDGSNLENARVARETCREEAITYHQDIKSMEPSNVNEIDNAAMLSVPDTEDAVYGVLECLEDMENLAFIALMVDDPVTGEQVGASELYRRNCYRNVNEDIVGNSDEDSSVGRAVISSRDDAATSLKRKLDSDDMATRKIRKEIREDLDDINDKKFRSSVEDLLYDKSLTGKGVEDLMESILDLAQDDLECDPRGIKGEPCDYNDEYHENNLDDITLNTAMRLHEEICELDGMNEDCWKDLEKPILAIVDQTAGSFYSGDKSAANNNDETYAKLDDLFGEISKAIEAEPNLGDQFDKVDDDALDDVLKNAAVGLISGLTDGDNWGMAEQVGGEFESCIDSFVENENLEVGDAAAKCLEYTSSAFSAEFNLDNKNN